MKTLFSFIITLFLLATPSALACVGCCQPGQTMGDDPQIVIQAGMGFSWSVIFMLVFVFSMIGIFSTYMAKTCMRLDHQKSEKYNS
ncbi:MAG: hypothetical protein ACK5LK_12190 [Chthoniobacterales bacterium]